MTGNRCKYLIAKLRECLEELCAYQTSYLQGRGLPYQKGSGDARRWISLRMFSDKGPQQGHLRYLLVLNPKKYDRRQCLFSELEPLWGKKHFKPHPQNWILVPFRNSLLRFRWAPLSFLMGVSLPPPPQVYISDILL